MSPLGAVINTTADNLRGQGANIRDTVIKLSQAFSALGDHSTDIFSTVKNLSILVSALQDSTDLMRPAEPESGVGDRAAGRRSRRGRRAVRDLNTVVGDVQTLRRRQPGVAGHHVRQAGRGVPGAERQHRRRQAVPARGARHVPELRNIYQPAQGAASAIAGGQQLRQPDRIPLRRSAGGVAPGRRAVGETVRAVSGTDHEEPPVQLSADRFQNPFVGATARPNEITYSEDWMRPDYIPPQPPHPPPPAPPVALAAEARDRAAAAPMAAAGRRGPPVATDPADGLPGMMVPPGGRTMTRASGCALAAGLRWRWR